MHSKNFCWLLALICLGGGKNLSAANTLHAMLAAVPPEANALMIVNGEKIRHSAWYAAAIKLAGPRGATNGPMPMAGIGLGVMAANMKMEGLQPAWIVAEFESAVPLSVENIAASFGGKSESLGTAAAVWLPGDTYAFSLAANRIGIVAQADRQFAARWARRATTANMPVELSPYLKQAADYAEKVGTEIVLALDLAELVRVDAAHGKLAVSPAVQAAKLDAAQLAQLLADVQGLTLGIRFAEGINGKLRIDFKRDPKLLQPLVKPLVMEVLAGLGAEIDDVAQWTTEIDGNTLFLGGAMSPRGVRQVLSLVEPPLLVPPQYGPAETALSKEAQASLSYYHAVTDMLDDLLKTKAEVITRGQYAMWFDRYARKLDALPVLNVDPDLLFCGAEIATRLRSLGGQNRMVGINAGTASSNTGASYSGNYVYNTTVWWKNTGLNDQQKTKQLETASAAASEVEQRQAIANGLGQIRREMTQKYQVEF